MNELEKVDYYNRLFDCYQSLFTVAQQEIFTDYYELDLSMQEIADNRQVSKAAIHDTIKRVEKSLQEYEAKLGLNQLRSKLFELNIESVNKILLNGQKEENND